MSQAPVPQEPVQDAQVVGTSDTGDGVVGRSRSGDGVSGVSETQAGVRGAGRLGVRGESSTGDGMSGQAGSGSGVSGISETGAGVMGKSSSGRGVHGISDGFIATVGDSVSGTGVWGRSVSGPGIYGVSDSGPAGHFEGDVEVTGDIKLSNQDGAEEFDPAHRGNIDAGTVMVIDRDGTVAESQRPYDRKVAGVISGAGDLRPAIILGKRSAQDQRIPIALFGTVNCKVDAQYGPVEVGDLLTTSATPGHAMAARDPLKAFGAVIGKALQEWTEGQGLIPVLIALQ